MNCVLFATRWSNPIERMTGIGRYMVGLVNALAAASPAELDFSCCGPTETAQPDWLPDRFDYRRARVPRIPLRLSWAAIGRPRLERLIGGFDLVHALHPTTPVPSEEPSVVTFHDLMPLEHPEWYGRVVAWAAKRAVERARDSQQQIIAVSNHTARQLIQYGNVDPSRVTVVYEGVENRFREPPSSQVTSDVCTRYEVQPGGYVLSVGNISTRKNLLTLVRAFSALPPTLKLLLCGNYQGQEQTIRAEVDRLGMRAQVRLTGFVPDVELLALLQGALLLAQPSVDEGFGLPALEAMAAGTPVIASDVASHSEIVGDAGLLLHPADIESWRTSIERVAEDEDIRKRLAQTGLSRSKKFTWERTAEDTVAVYRRALKQ